MYLTALIPKSKGIGVVEARREIKKENESAVLHAPRWGSALAVPALEPGKAWEGQLQSYMGPMEYERLKALGVGLEKAIYFGGFPFPESWAVHYGLPTFPMEYIVVPTLAMHAVVLPLRPELRRRDHPADGDHEGAALPAHREEHDGR